MAKTESKMIDLGAKAVPFSLTNGLDDQTHTLSTLVGEKGLLVLFICNHCPYVLHILDPLVKFLNDCKQLGIGVVAISSNDIDQFPEDSPKLMEKLAKDHHFNFPYLYDESQSVAKAYDAACTPDFFLYDQNLSLVYRGRFDGSTPGNSVPVTGSELSSAVSGLILGRAISEIQLPSLGCNIKWK